MKNLTHLVLLALGLLVAALSVSIVIESVTGTHEALSQMESENSRM
jgi:hypothetical protein